jgi:LysM repeat protein
MIFLVLAIALVGCRRSAAPPLEELTPEDEETAAMQEAEENTETSESDETEAEETSETTVEPTATEVPTEEETPEPTPEPTETEAAVEEADETATPEPTQAATTPGTHVVQPGENLFRIALRYGTTVQTIAQANNITNPSLIYVGQRLTIPSGTNVPSPTPGEKTYVVKPGDNLFRIALRHNLDQYYLARYNGIENPSLIYVGQVIRIP